MLVPSIDTAVAHIRRDAEAGRLEGWGQSTLIDEFTGVPSIERELFDTLHAAAGLTATFPVGNAGVLHVYGYWFSEVPTPFGYKRDRWADGALRFETHSGRRETCGPVGFRRPKCVSAEEEAGAGRASTAHQAPSTARQAPSTERQASNAAHRTPSTSPAHKPRAPKRISAGPGGWPFWPCASRAGWVRCSRWAGPRPR